MNHGFVRVAAGVIKVSVANTKSNATNIVDIIKEAYSKGVQILVCPELSITSYTCQDLFFQNKLLDEAKKSLEYIVRKTSTIDTVSIVGVPLLYNSKLYNCAVVIQKGHILGIVPKSYIPNYGEFYEKRWFVSGKDIKNKQMQLFEENVPFGVDLIFRDARDSNITFGIEICEDLWAVIPPSSLLSRAGANMIFNLSASNELIGKYKHRRELVCHQSYRCMGGYIYVSAGVGESTTDLVFGGHAIISESGDILNESERFIDDNHLTISDIDILNISNERMKNTSHYNEYDVSVYRSVSFNIRQIKMDKLYRHIARNPFVPSDKEKLNKTCKEAFTIQTMGLAQRLIHIGIDKVVIGVSGGLDSTLALFVAVNAFKYLNIPCNNIKAITMPGFGTTNDTKSNAEILIEALQVDNIEIDIKDACLKHFSSIGHAADMYDVTYENVQARERTQILMDLANKNNAIVIGTGDMSELALGWCTYNGDHMSMYGVNSGIPKTLVRCIVNWIKESEDDNRIKKALTGIINTPISPELIPTKGNDKNIQKTEDIIGKYDLHDFFLYNFMKHGSSPSKVYFLAKEVFGEDKNGIIKDTLKTFVKRFFGQQFKRSCMPDGVKIGHVGLSPRGDLKMPSDAKGDIWLDDLDEI
ncbi:MAG: NAD(+) synthase [Clostridiales bacterium]|nr:NAD(+) synthase [Clostridiales bacterium]